MTRVVSMTMLLPMALAASMFAIADEACGQTSYPPETPLFTRHVVPLFSRLGCNAGTCHGKVKGENGFRLSLFGVDAKADHASLLKEFGGRRVNLGDVDASMLLLKPLGDISHGGGKLIERGSPEHEVMRRWLAAGAKLDPLDQSRVQQLAVTPARQTLKMGEKVSLRAEVTFGDGTTEDVTALCRFDAVNRDVVAISASGEVSATAVGDTAIVVRYGAEPTVAMVMVPGEPISFPSVTAHNFIDDHVFAKLRTLNIPPGELCDDATFLRRASLDITGTLPAPDEIRKFLAASDADKRAKKIDELLQRPGHTAVWTTKLCDILRPTGFDGNYGLVEAAENRRFYEWIRARLGKNLPYDELAVRILTATSQEDRSYEGWIDEVLQMSEENVRQKSELATYAHRRTLDLYWQRKDATGVKGTVQVAHAFLGLRMECAQCHRHPHDVWTQNDLLSFANFFNQLKGARYPDKKEMPEAIAKMFEELPKEAKKLEEPLKELREKRMREVNEKLNKTREDLQRAKQENKDEGKVRDLESQLAQCNEDKAKIEQEIAELEAQRGRMNEGPKRFGTDVRHNSERIQHASVESPLGSQRSEQFRLLGSDEPMEVGKEKDPRDFVVAWLRSPENPFFARAMVNRVWAHYFGRGIVDPPDHLSPLNPPSHPELLDELARKFIENKYDLRWLHRTIAASRTYQLSTSPPAVKSEQLTAAKRNFAYFQLRRLPAEVLVDAVNDATGSQEEFPKQLYLAEKSRAIEVAGVTSREDQEAALSYAFKIFGRPLRSGDVQCDCERDTNTTIVQTLYLANHPRVRDKIYSETGSVAKLLQAEADADRRIEAIYLSTVSRLPSESERAACRDYVAARESSLVAYQDVLWSLLNTREFILNH